jgi:hypothetical protein
MPCAAYGGAASAGERCREPWNNGKPHYRCIFLSQYAAKKKNNHPPSANLREELLLPQLDAWLSRRFDPIALAAWPGSADADHHPADN